MIRRYEVMEIPPGDAVCPSHGIFWLKRHAWRRARKLVETGMDARGLVILPLKLGWYGEFDLVERFGKGE